MICFVVIHVCCVLATSRALPEGWTEPRGLEELRYAGSFRSAAEESAFIARRVALGTRETPHADMNWNTVFVNLELYQIVETNEVNMMMSLKFFIYVFYCIPALSWNDSESTNYAFTTPLRTFWIPDIVAYDMTEMKSQAFSKQIIYRNGVVVAWSSLIFADVACNFDVTYFPYDVQHCQFALGQWAFNNQSYRLQADMGLVNEKLSKQNEQWRMISPLRAEPGYRYFPDELPHSTLEYFFTIERRPEFYQKIIILPTFALLVLSSLVFVLPVEAGEKCGLALTVLLAQMVNLLVLQDILPPSAIHFPILGNFFLFTTVITAGSVFATMVVINVHFMTRPVPDWIRRRMTKSHSNHELMYISPMEHANKEGGHDIVKGSKSSLESGGKEERNLWEELSRWLDRIFLLVYICIMVSGTFYYSCKLQMIQVCRA